jgi:NADH dehydrogenase [ubiquinone] 1 alpha subcomplex assembly factor 7
MGKPEKFALLELGPGRGTLMQDALRATEKISDFHQAINLHLLESNETLRQMQREKLAAYRPVYITDLTSDLPHLPIIIIANEFFDALSIRQFEKTFQGWSERLIATENNKLTFILSPTDAKISALIPENMREAHPGTVYELGLPGLSVTLALAQHIAKHGGVALIIDYGFVEPSGKPTLQAVSQHQYTGILTRPGEGDLTAHVNFGALQNMALHQKTVVLGPIGQGEFLQSLGIELRAVQLKQRSTPNQAKDIDDALRRLTDASQMGTLFKVMALSSPEISSLAGF